MTLLKCEDGLIGDFLGIIPAMIALSKKDELHVKINPEAEEIFHLIPKKYGIKLQNSSIDYNTVIELEILKSFAIAERKNYYMSQASFASIGLPVPSIAPKAEFEFELTESYSYDYVLAPFSRSLPPEQRWPQTQWQQLIDMMPEKSFCIIGHARDEKKFVTGNSVSELYNEPLIKLINILKNAKHGLISVVSGPSHLAFHLGVKNYLLTNQPSTWGVNPDAIKIRNYIPKLKALEVAEILCKG